ncbi:ribokinase [Oceanobacillus salinisoli]|uniref:ribokinase n=1 Tax=Oceanobacillus salinisoli TaxID=2678611 RepID=UPI0012E20163|nr:ribokinase [Oceanobacillus salinisoli]
MSIPKVAIIGSINMDLVTGVSRIPSLGETIIGDSFTTNPGGKGANQAVACSRLGAEVTIYGCVGNDDYGKRLMQNLERENVSTSSIQVIDNVPTGIASITIKVGDNSIIVVPGANSYLTPEFIRSQESSLKKADVILASLEIPISAVTMAAEIAHNYEIPFILNPAPAIKLPQDLQKKTTLITPNEHELPILLGKENYKNSEELIFDYEGPIVMTKGSHGAFYKGKDSKITHVPSHNVTTVDSTGAGDAFNAGIAFMLGKRESLKSTVEFAVVVGALAVTKLGAQEGMPTIEEVEAQVPCKFSEDGV